jgi:hypothetical protein
MTLVRAAAIALVTVTATTATPADRGPMGGACFMPVEGPETGSVYKIHNLPDGAALIYAGYGWFRFDTAGWRKVSAVPTDFAYAMHDLPRGKVLIAAGKGWFRFDPAGTGQVVPVGEPVTGSVLEAARWCCPEMHDLSDGKVLIRADKGWFRFDPAGAGQVVPVGEPVTGFVFMHDLPGGAVLIHAENRLFRFDPGAEHVLPMGEEATGFVYKMHGLPGGAVLIAAANGLFRFDPATGRVMLAGEAARGPVKDVHDLPGGAVLVGANNGLFRFDPVVGGVVPAGEAVTGAVLQMHGLTGGVLIQAANGWFRFDPGAGQVLPMGKEATGTVFGVQTLTGGAVLIYAANGWFRFDPGAGQVLSVSKMASTGSVYGIQDLTGDAVLIHDANGWFLFEPAAGRVIPTVELATASWAKLYPLRSGTVLIGASNGLFRFDPAAGRVIPMALGQVNDTNELPSGAVLIATGNGLWEAPATGLAKAKVTWLTDLQGLRPSPVPAEIQFTLSHPCAPTPTTGNFGLMLVPAVDGTERGGQPVRLVPGVAPSTGSARLAASIVLDRSGDWSLQVRQGAAAIAQPLRFSIVGLAVPSIWEILLSAWKMMVGVLAGLYAFAFAVLLFLTRWHAWAFRIVSDAAWATFLTWPFFLLRQAPAVQRWVLQPWFQEVRRSMRTDVPFLDPPISNSSGQLSEGSALLYRLREAPRLWLQGRSGMGKSSVFAAWERAYFAEGEAPTLDAAVRRYGFILVMLPVRHYAALSPPEANRPESWVLDAVRRRLEQFGLATRDPGLIEAMLKAGQIALALDGTNEADRDAAIAAFARQFPQVRLLVTSQATGWEHWDAWHLPENVGALRNELLALWLGADKGECLSRRIVAEGLSDAIVSGYDLRLIADLAGADPEHTPLPANRIALYRAMLARATGAGGEPLHLEGLKQLAWKMANERRREIRSEDEKLLGAGTLKALAKEGLRIVRPVGEVHEFRHDQMRAFLAALWLVEETPNLSALEKIAIDAGAFALNRRDQEELWRFVGALLVSPEDIRALWCFVNEDPEWRGILLAAVQAEADDRDITLIRPARRRRSKAAGPASAQVGEPM